jgi:hypothetical protein
MVHHLTEMANTVTRWWVLCEVCVYILTATATIPSFLRFSPVSIILTVLHRHHLNVPLTRRTNVRSVGAFQKSTLFWVSECTVHPPPFLCCTLPTAHMPITLPFLLTNGLPNFQTNSVSTRDRSCATSKAVDSFLAICVFCDMTPCWLVFVHHCRVSQTRPLASS